MTVTVNLIGAAILLGWLLLDWRRAAAWMRWVVRVYRAGPPSTALKEKTDGKA